MYAIRSYYDVTSVFTNAASVDDLVFRITMEDLGGNANDPLPDGLYFIQYKVRNNGGRITSYNVCYTKSLRLELDYAQDTVISVKSERLRESGHYRKG